MPSVSYTHLIFNAISSLALSFFSNRQTGGLMTQVNNDATTIYWFFCDGFPYFVTNALQFIVVLVIMFATDWLLTLYTFITVSYTHLDVYKRQESGRTPGRCPPAAPR